MEVVTDCPWPRFNPPRQHKVKPGALIVSGMIDVAVRAPETPVIFRLY
jgi:hypothetical protein